MQSDNWCALARKQRSECIGPTPDQQSDNKLCKIARTIDPTAIVFSRIAFAAKVQTFEC